jgi:tetratricopeptide (TPR) repeat protein
MKKRMLTITVMVLMVVMTGNAQVGAYDRAIPLPTRDLYDTQTMNMALAHAQMAARVEAQRKELFSIYANRAVEAYNNRQWGVAINCVNNALETTYYSAEVYYIRGYAYEQLGYYRDAKRDYKKAKRYGSEYAASALESLKIKMKKK